MDLIVKKALTYFKHPLVNDFYQKYNLISSNYPDYPYLNYFGINFDKEGICSFKIYFHFFHKMKEKEVNLFLPKTEDFFNYYHLHDSSKTKNVEHSGCAMEIKFKGEKEPVIGFHYRLRPTQEAYDLIGFPKQIPFNMLEVGTRPGINYEYSYDGSALRKKYYYFYEQTHKKYFAERFNNPFLEKVNLIEYTESDLFAKLNAWRFDFTDENMNRPNPFNNEAQKIINYLKDNYGLVNISDGYYENKPIRASYYFNLLKQDTNSPFEIEENRNIDTLKLFL